MSTPYTTTSNNGAILTRKDLLRWGTVRAGLALNFGGSLLIYLCLGIFIVILYLNSGQIKPGAPMLTVLLLTLAGYGILGGTAIVLVGACMTSAAPRGTTAKRWGIGTCVFAILAVILAVVWLIGMIDAHQRQPTTVPVDEAGQAVKAPPVVGTPVGEQEMRFIGFGFQGAYLLAVTCFLLCLRAIAKQFGREGLAVGISFYLLVYIAFMAGANVLGRNLSSAVDVQDLLRISAMILGGFVLVEIWGLVLLAMTRGALTEGMLRS